MIHADARFCSYSLDPAHDYFMPIQPFGRPGGLSGALFAVSGRPKSGRIAQTNPGAMARRKAESMRWPERRAAGAGLNGPSLRGLEPLVRIAAMVAGTDMQGSAAAPGHARPVRPSHG